MDNARTKRIEERIQARKDAESWLAMVLEAAEAVPAHCKDAYFKVFNSQFGNVSSQPSRLPPMTDAQVEHFRNVIMPWGLHSGRPISKVPLAYLDYITGQSRGFDHQLRQYLANPGVAKQLQEELDGE